MKDLHGSIKIESVKVFRPYIIEVVFGDGTSRKIDLEEILYGKMYGPLKDVDIFQKVQVNPEVATIEWPNGADFDPETLYNWPKYKDYWIEKAQSWSMPEEI